MSYASELRAVDAAIGRSTRRGDGPSLSWDASRGGYVARDAWRVPMAHFTEAMDVIAGSTEVVTFNSQFGSRWVPLRFEFYPDKLVAVRASADWEGLDPAGDRTTCIISVEYESPQHAIGAGANVDIQTRPTTFPLKLADGTSAQVPGHFVDATLDNLQSFTPSAWVWDYVPVNNATWRGYPAGTVALMPPEASNGPSVGTGNAWRVRFPFEVRSRPWDADEPDPGDPVYVATNFSTLLGF